ncbi:MAG: hypothetical protein FWG82_05035 [Oscillospiraceae bacterium]|nr:hypothetical protein [Oscillospiraceae bacterium]
MKICPKCGTKNKLKDKRCFGCGLELNLVQPPKDWNLPTPPMNSETQPQAPAQTPQQLPQQPANYEPPISFPMPNLKLWAVLVFCVGVIAFIIVAIGGSLMYPDDPYYYTDSPRERIYSLEPTTEEFIYDVFGLGESIVLDDFTVTAQSVREIQPTPNAIPDDGNIFLEIVFDFENNTDDILNLRFVRLFGIYVDNYHTSFSYKAQQASTSPLQGLGATVPTALDVGENVKGIYCLEVPWDWEVISISIRDAEFLIENDLE